MEEENVATQSSLQLQPNTNTGNEAEKTTRQVVPEECMHKNRLQHYTQRSSLPFPQYHTINEGTPHAPLFRSSVFVDGTWYKSPSTFSQVKVAEQDAAKVALSSVKEKLKNEGCSLICEDMVFCKSILNEYAAKMNLKIPTYTTVQSERLLPAFRSTVNINASYYVGLLGRNKKEAEQLAARAAVMSILATDSGTISEIIKSKRRLYAALEKIQDTGDSNAAILPMDHARETLGLPIHVDNKRKVDDVAEHGTKAGALTSNLGQPSDIQASNQLHVFKNPKLGSSSMEVVPPNPIEFVPPVLGTSMPCSTSVKKRKKNKKRAKKNVQVNLEMPGVMLESTHLPPCSVAQ